VLLQFGGAGVNKIIYQTESQVQRKEVLPDKWDTGVVCLFHKKGALMVCTNCTGAMLLNTAYTVLSNILNFVSIYRKDKKIHIKK
jgi:hypothetical protein